MENRETHFQHVNLSHSHTPCSSFNFLFDPAAFNDALRRTHRLSAYALACLLKKFLHVIGNKAVVCALSASYVSTFAGYPVISLPFFLMHISLSLSLYHSSILSNPGFRQRKRPSRFPGLRALFIAKKELWASIVDYGYPS